MGYTRSWEIKRDITIEEWSEFIEKVKTIFDNASVLGIRLSLFFNNSKPPYVGKESIEFNGYVEGCESCRITRVRRKNQKTDCKTWRRPYDRVVASVLLALKEILKEDMTVNEDDCIGFMSDGESMGNSLFYPEDYLLNLYI